MLYWRVVIWLKRVPRKAAAPRSSPPLVPTVWSRALPWPRGGVLGPKTKEPLPVPLSVRNPHPLKFEGCTTTVVTTAVAVTVGVAVLVGVAVVVAVAVGVAVAVAVFVGVGVAVGVLVAVAVLVGVVVAVAVLVAVPVAVGVTVATSCEQVLSRMVTLSSL